jgi:hypothetical protein
MYVNRDKTSRVSRSKHPAQDARTINEKDDEKCIAQKFNQRKVSYHSSVTRKISLWLGVNHNKMEMTAEINSNLRYAI